MNPLVNEALDKVDELRERMAEGDDKVSFDAGSLRTQSGHLGTRTTINLHSDDPKAPAAVSVTVAYGFRPIKPDDAATAPESPGKPDQPA